MLSHNIKTNNWVQLNYCTLRWVSSKNGPAYWFFFFCEVRSCYVNFENSCLKMTVYRYLPSIPWTIPFALQTLVFLIWSFLEKHFLSIDPSWARRSRQTVTVTVTVSDSGSQNVWLHNFFFSPKRFLPQPETADRLS